MDIKIVNLYDDRGIPQSENARGILTAYIPKLPSATGEGRRIPAVLVLPGGGYGHVSPREGEPVALRFAARGWAAFVLEYSVAPFRYPTALREAAMAMAHIRSNAGAYSIHPGMVAAVGFSAGGHLCGCLGTLFDSPELADIGGASLLRPDALGLHYPVTVSWGRTHAGSFRNLTGEDASLAEKLSLDALARPDMPPAFLWHTRSDGSVPCRSSLVLAAAMEEAGVDFVLHIYRTGKHGLSLADGTVYPEDSPPEVSADVPGWLEAELEFFREIGLKP